MGFCWLPFTRLGLKFAICRWEMLLGASPGSGDRFASCWRNDLFFGLRSRQGLGCGAVEIPETPNSLSPEPKPSTLIKKPEYVATLYPFSPCSDDSRFNCPLLCRGRPQVHGVQGSGDRRVLVSRHPFRLPLYTGSRRAGLRK